MSFNKKELFVEEEKEHIERGVLHARGRGTGTEGQLRRKTDFIIAVHGLGLVSYGGIKRRLPQARTVTVGSVVGALMPFIVLRACSHEQPSVRRSSGRLQIEPVY